MFGLLFVSLEDLLREEVQKQIDITLKDIEHDYSKLTGPNVRSRWDFVYGYEYGCIITAVADYYRYRIVGNKGTAEEQGKYVAETIKEIVLDRLPEVRQAISRAEIKLK
jgi:hypothetical protein